MKRREDRWFAMRTDLFGRDGYDLGIYKLTPQAIGLYVSSVAYVCKWGTDEIHDSYARQLITRPGPAIRELANLDFWHPLGKNLYGVNHEGTLWRRGDPRQRPAIPLAVRRKVMERDGFACLECGETGRLTLDHIHPYSLGGTDAPGNLRVLCRPCNSRKGARV